MRKTLVAVGLLLSLCTVAVLPVQVVKSTILWAKCVGCGDCVRSCPVQAIMIRDGKAVVDVDKCVGCRTCVKICSYGAAR